MKRKTRRRLLAGLLAVLMVVGIMPFDLFGNMVKVDAAEKDTYVWNFEYENPTEYKAVGGNFGANSSGKTIKSSNSDEKSIVVNTYDNGKFSNTAGDRAQFSTSTAIYVPVSGSGTIKVTAVNSTNAGYMQFGESATSGSLNGSESSYEYTSSNYSIVNETNYIKITPSVTSYICAIERIESGNDAKWNFKPETESETTSVCNIQKTTGYVDSKLNPGEKLYVDARGTGKLYSARNGVQMKNSVVYIPISTKGTVTVKAKIGNFSLGTTISSSGTSVSYDFDVEEAGTSESPAEGYYVDESGNKYVKLVYTLTSDEYIYSIVVEEDKPSAGPVNEETYTMEREGNAENVCALYNSTDPENLGEAVDVINGTAGIWKNSTKDKIVNIDATNGKISKNNADNFQLNAGTKLTFPVVDNATSCTISWKNFSGYAITGIKKNDSIYIILPFPCFVNTNFKYFFRFGTNYSLSFITPGIISAPTELPSDIIIM